MKFVIVDTTFREIPQFGKVVASWNLPKWGFIKRIKGVLGLWHDYPTDLYITIEYAGRVVPVAIYPKDVEILRLETEGFADLFGGKSLSICIDDQYEDDGGEWYFTELVIEYSLLPNKVFVLTGDKNKIRRKKKKKKLLLESEMD